MLGMCSHWPVFAFARFLLKRPVVLLPVPLPITYSLRFYAGRHKPRRYKGLARRQKAQNQSSPPRFHLRDAEPFLAQNRRNSFFLKHLRVSAICAKPWSLLEPSFLVPIRYAVANQLSSLL